MKDSEKLIKIKVGILLKVQLKIAYHDVTRDIEPHVLGYNHEGFLILRGFEKVKDDVETNQFKLYLLSDIKSISVSNIKFHQTVTKSTDEAMKKIILTTYNDKKKKKKGQRA